MLSVNHQILSLVLCANVNSNNLIIHLFKELGIDYLGGPVLHLYMAYALAISLKLVYWCPFERVIDFFLQKR